MKILITGAHFTPAQAVIEELQKFNEIARLAAKRATSSLSPRNDNQVGLLRNDSITSGESLEIVYIGRKYTIEGDKSPSVESQVLPKLGVKFIPINAGRVRRVWEFRTITSFLKIPIGFLQAFYLLVKEQPAVVLSFGGYIGVPVVISAWLLNIPVLIHEQTLVSGLANKISSFFADKIAVSFDQEYPFNKSKLLLTGNPLRKQLFSKDLKISSEIQAILNSQKKEKLPLVYITGGNQGSHALNQAVGGLMADLAKKALVIHQTGESKFNDYEALLKASKEDDLGKKYLVKKWLEADDVAAILQNADLCISRAGANTLLELAYFGIPTIVVPIDYLYKNEQMVNSKYFKKLGLVQIIEQKNLSSQVLEKVITQSLKDLPKLKKEAGNAKKAVILDAEKKLSLEVILLANMVTR